MARNPARQNPVASEEVAAPTTDSNQDSVRKMLTESELLELLPFSRSTLYSMMKRNQFPRGTFISENRRIWFLDEVVGWQRAIEANDPLRSLRHRRNRARS
jgi:predicted DNA-binding transcriptional regulator AlpA